MRIGNSERDTFGSDKRIPVKPERIIINRDQDTTKHDNTRLDHSWFSEERPDHLIYRN